MATSLLATCFVFLQLCLVIAARCVRRQNANLTTLYCQNVANLNELAEEISTPNADLAIFLTNSALNLTKVEKVNVATLRFLEITLSDIQVIESAFFEDLPELSRLSLSDCHIDNFEPFPSAPKLEAIVSKRNILGDAPHDLFANLSGLREVLWEDTEMLGEKTSERLDWRELPKQVFRGLPIESLRLRGNRIADIERGTFSNLSHLRMLDLGANELKEVFFSNLSSLARLDLSQNALEVLNDSHFAHLSNLTHLNVSENKLKKLEPLLAVGSLRQLDASHNRLTEVRFATSALQTLKLCHNRIEELTEETFGKLVALKSLHVSHNPHLRIAAKAFRNLTRLEFLDLSQVGLSEIPSLANLTELKQLNLSGNVIEEVAPTAFANLTHLEELNLKDNRIRMLGVSSFAGLKALKVLNLEGNALSALAGNVFEGVRLRFLFLGGNALEEVAEEVVNKQSELTWLGLDSNPLKDLAFLKRLPALAFLKLKGTRFENDTAILVNRKKFRKITTEHWDSWSPPPFLINK